MRRADNLTTFMCRLSWNLVALPSRNLQGLSRPVMGLLYLLFPLVLTSVSVICPFVSEFCIPHICCSLLPYFHIGFSLCVLMVVVAVVIIAYRASTSAHGATYFRLLWPCIMNVVWTERNQQDATNLMFIIKLLSQHVSGIIMPIIRRTRVCTAAYGVLHCNKRGTKP